MAASTASGFGHVGLAPALEEVADAAEGAGAEAQHGNAEAGAAEIAVFHGIVSKQGDAIAPPTPRARQAPSRNAALPGAAQEPDGGAARAHLLLLVAFCGEHEDGNIGSGLGQLTDQVDAAVLAQVKVDYRQLQRVRQWAVQPVARRGQVVCHVHRQVLAVRPQLGGRPGCEMHIVLDE